jgi:hypothetical protein
MGNREPTGQAMGITLFYGPFLKISLDSQNGFLYIGSMVSLY